MAAGLEQLGVKFVSQGEAAFQRNINLGAKALGALEAAATIAAGPLAIIGSALGNVAQIALGILGRDLIRGIFKGVKSIFDDAAKAIFGSADALKELKDNANKARDAFPDLNRDLQLARLKLDEFRNDEKASASDIVGAMQKVQEIEAEISKNSATIRENAAAQRQYAASLAGQFSVFRSSLVGVAKTVIEKFLPTLTNAFQRLSPIILNLATMFGNFIANPVFLAKAQQLVDWLSYTLPLALDRVRKAIQPVIDIFTGSGSWSDKLAAAGQLILNWFEDMSPMIISRVRIWGESLTSWITEQGAALAEKIRSEWGPRFVSWITDPATLSRAGTMLGTFAAWFLDQGMRLFSAVANSIGQIFLSILGVQVSGDAATNVVTTFLSSFWTAFSQSQVFKQIEFMLYQTWTAIQRIAINTFTDIVMKVLSIWAQFKTALKNTWNAISETLIFGYLYLRDHTFDIFNKIKDGLTAIWTKVSDTAKKVWGDVHFAVLSSYYDLENKLKLAWSLFAGDVQRAWDKITAPIIKVWTTVHDFLTDPTKRQEWYDAAVNWIKGFISGLGSMASALYNKVKDLVYKYIIQPVLDFLGMHSPSTVGIEMGVNFGASFGLGMKQALQGVALNAFAQVSPPSMNGGGVSNVSYSSSTSYAPSLTINSPAPANVRGSFALMNALVSGPYG